MSLVPRFGNCMLCVIKWVYWTCNHNVVKSYWSWHTFSVVQRDGEDLFVCSGLIAVGSSTGVFIWDMETYQVHTVLTTCIWQKQTSNTRSAGERQEVPVTCEFDIKHGLELSGVCEGNGDGGVGANQGWDAQRLLALWIKATSTQKHTPFLQLKAETN